MLASATIAAFSGRVLAQETPSPSGLEEGLVAVTVPIRPLGVSFGMTEGKRVNVVLSVPLVTVDGEFQSILPNGIAAISRGENGELAYTDPLPGRVEPNTLSTLGSIVVPSEPQRPRIVTQQVIQDVEILHMDTHYEEINLNPNAAPIPVRVTLAVTTQDALMLTWAMQADLRIDLLLRSEDEQTSSIAETRPVSLQYLADQYGYDSPPNLPFSIQPSDNTP
jgi:hypothetical protein